MAKMKKGAVSVEYILLAALLGIGAIVGLMYMKTQMEINHKAQGALTGQAFMKASRDNATGTGSQKLLEKE